MPPALQDYLRDMARLRNGVLPPLTGNVAINRGTQFFVFTYLTGIHLLARIFARTLVLVRQSCEELLTAINLIVEADVADWFSQLNNKEQAEAMGWTLYFFLTPFGLALWLFVSAVILTADIAQYAVLTWIKGVAVLTRWIYARLRAMFQRLYQSFIEMMRTGVRLLRAIMDTIEILISLPFYLTFLCYQTVTDRIQLAQGLEDMENFRFYED